jgi:putative membrane protein
MAELVPGVSGGTVALVTGVFEQLIDSATHVLSAVRRLVSGPDRLAGARAELGRAEWLLIVPVLVGMATAVGTVAGTMEEFVSGSPELARGLFFGLVVVSVAVPVRMLPAGTRPAWVDAALVGLVTVAAFWLVGLAGGAGEADVPLVLVFGAAAVAICALVVPGVSGSFFLLTVGLYTVTLEAVDERDLGYLAVFAAGAIAGLAAFVPVLHYLLERRRRTTLLVMIGLMLGSLRALWPWQAAPTGAASEEAQGPGALLAPYDPVLGPVLLAVLGAAVVLVLVVVEARRAGDTSQEA